MSQTRTVVLDTNAVIHFLLAYDMSKFKVVARTLNNNQCYVPTEVIVESVYILDGKFHIDRKTIAEKLKDFITIQEGLVSMVNAVTYGLNLYASSKFDIVDCLLVGYAKTEGDFVLTFDSDLEKELAEQAFIS